MSPSSNFWVGNSKIDLLRSFDQSVCLSQRGWGKNKKMLPSRAGQIEASGACSDELETCLTLRQVRQIYQTEAESEAESEADYMNEYPTI